MLEIQSYAAKILRFLCAFCLTSFEVVVHLVLAGGQEDKQLYEYIEQVPTEDGLKLHRCTLCGKTGNHRNNLRKHVESLHFPGSFRYSCKYCREEFDTKTKLNNHVMRVCGKITKASFPM